MTFIIPPEKTKQHIEECGQAMTKLKARLTVLDEGIAKIFTLEGNRERLEESMKNIYPALPKTVSSSFCVDKVHASICSLLREMIPELHDGRQLTITFGPTDLDNGFYYQQKVETFESKYFIGGTQWILRIISSIPWPYQDLVEKKGLIEGDIKNIKCFSAELSMAAERELPLMVGLETLSILSRVKREGF